MKNWLAVILVFLGILVGVISLYTASLAGVMGKMGLVGGDFSQEVDVNELARYLREEEVPDCRPKTTMGKIPQYLLSRGQERLILSGELGSQRIICGVIYTQNQNVERGTYTVVKGLYYLKNYYGDLRRMVQTDESKCGLMMPSKYEGYVEGYLNATRGRVNEVVYEVYKQVEDMRAGVDELCID